MNIFKTFETFLKEPLSILRDNFIQIVSVQTENFFKNKDNSYIDVSTFNKKTQITIVNNEKMYNLLSLVNHKAQIKEKKMKEKVLNNETT